MKVKLIRVKQHLFKDTEYTTLHEFDEWKHNHLPIAGDIFVYYGKTYRILQRTWLNPDDVELFVEYRFKITDNEN